MNPATANPGTSPDPNLGARGPRLSVVTGAGLLLAIFGTPLLLWLLRLGLGEADSLPSYLARDLGVFALAGILLVLIRRGERLPYSSIGWRTDRLGRSAIWGLIGLVLSIVAIAACFGVAQLMEWKVGQQEPPKFVPPLWAMTITVLRAGLTEELFYRGYALERLSTLTGSTWIAAVPTITLFGLFHSSQGPAGILIAAVVATIFTVLYLRRRDLPAVMLTHVAIDLIPNVLLPLLGVAVDD
ncbi:MAG: CPBP family intramembrane metalloprotease [Sinobacteraceae bacterium]|nr:CPBP family intramembrane metalloprotease [Nevskiaceae bacterium]